MTTATGLARSSASSRGSASKVTRSAGAPSSSHPQLADNGGASMETISVVLSVKPDQVEAFEAGFREHELPIWQDYHARGIMTSAAIAKMDISSVPRGDAVQYLIVVAFATGEGHHLHDGDPRFEAW